MPDIAEQKRLLREKLLPARKSFNENLYLEANGTICENILKIINLSKNQVSFSSIGFYYPLLGEPDLFKLLFLKEEQFALPSISNQSMSFVKYTAGDSLENMGFREVYQPAKKTITFPNLIIVPGLSFSISGYRLGFGNGYYDKYFASHLRDRSILTIGVCFHDKLTEYLPFNENDHKFDYIVTEKILINI